VFAVKDELRGSVTVAPHRKIPVKVFQDMQTYTVELVDVAECVLHLLDIDSDQVYIIIRSKEGQTGNHNAEENKKKLEWSTKYLLETLIGLVASSESSSLLSDFSLESLAPAPEADPETSLRRIDFSKTAVLQIEVT
jgi:hypothetical protein